MSNLLSFGEQPETVKLTKLNILIGPNGSGKSNFIEVLGLLQSAPKELSTAIINGGPIEEWLRKGGSGIPKASIEAIISRSGNALPNGRGGNRMPLRYKLRFSPCAFPA